MGWLASVLLLVACGKDATPAPGGGSGGAGGGQGGEAQGGGGQGGGAGGMEQGGGGEGGTGNVGSLVVGVDHPPDEQDLYAASLHVVMKVDDAVVTDQVFGTGTPAIIPLPREFAFEDLPGGAAVEIVFEIKYDIDFPVVERVARSTIVVGRKSLLRVMLSQRLCASCDTGLTCNWGRCLDPYLPPDVLEDYVAEWASYSYCKQAAPGAPVVVLGTGGAAFTALNDADIVDVWAGPQGGHHLYGALRMNNLKQSSIARLSAYVPALDLHIGPISYLSVFPDDPLLGFCDTFGKIFQLDAEVSIDQLLGQTIELTGEVLDDDGDMATQTRTAVLSSVIQ